MPVQHCPKCKTHPAVTSLMLTCKEQPLSFLFQPNSDCCASVPGGLPSLLAPRLDGLCG